jgi:hypothetical protein
MAEAAPVGGSTAAFLEVSMPPLALAGWRRVFAPAALVAAMPLALLACSAPAGRSPTPSALPTASASVPATPGSPDPVGSTVPGGSTSTTKEVPSGPGVTITRTGGLAGVMQVIAVAADGSWTYTDRRAGTSQQGKLTTAQRQDLARLAIDPALAAEARRSAPPDPCADGFVYTITLGEASTRYEQCGAGNRPVTDQLLALVLGATPM